MAEMCLPWPTNTFVSKTNRITEKNVCLVACAPKDPHLCLQLIFSICLSWEDPACLYCCQHVSKQAVWGVSKHRPKEVSIFWQMGRAPLQAGSFKSTHSFIFPLEQIITVTTSLSVSKCHMYSMSPDCLWCSVITKWVVGTLVCSYIFECSRYKSSVSVTGTVVRHLSDIVRAWAWESGSPGSEWCFCSVRTLR